MTVDNDLLRLEFVPAQLGRLCSLTTRGADIARIDQLHALRDAPGMFVWFNPWYGGVHPVLQSGGQWNFPGKLRE